MAHKVIIINDPGIDGAFALALALHDPNLDVQVVAASAGNISARQATENVHIVIEHMDAPRWPRVGSALPVAYDVDAKRLHGPTGLGPTSLPCVQLHHPHSGDKLIVDYARLHPKEITVLVLGPATVLARALDRDPELPSLVQRIICVGGCWREPGNASPVAEFHFFCDPPAARQVVRCGAPLTLVPLDVSRQLIFSPADLTDLLPGSGHACAFLRKILPFGIGTTSNTYGVEGFQLKDVTGLLALALPECLTTRPMVVDVETRGELTRGMIVVDTRPGTDLRPNLELAVDIDLDAARKYIPRVLRRTCA